MNIFLTGYLDRNFGDDIMIRIIADNFKKHRFYIKVSRDELFIPFEKDTNIFKLRADEKIEFDLFLTVIGSGFMLRGITSIMYFIKEERVRRRMCKSAKTAVIGCNIGPFGGSLEKWLVINRLRSYDMISARDRVSYEFVRKHAPKVEAAVFPDIAFSIPDKWIPDVECEGHLGISAYRNIHNSNLNYYREIAETADNFIERSGKKVLLFAFDVEYENDLCAAHTIKSFMRYAQNAEIVAHIDNGENVLKNLRRCGIILAGRLHMSIMAIRLGIPFIPLAYSEKTVNALSEIGYKEKILKINDVTAECLNNIIFSVRPFTIKEQLIENARGHVDCLKKLIK